MRQREAARLVRVTEAPTIPGLRFRGYAGPADLPPMAEAQNEAHAADGVDEAVTPDVLANDLLGDARIDVERDIVIVELDRIIAGWSGRWRWVEDATGDAILSHRGYLAPAARRRGIGRALLRHNECQLREDALLPAASGRRLFHSWTDEAMIGTTTLLRAEGYAATRWFFEMLRPTLDDLPAAALPPGLEVRPVLTEPQAMAVMLAEDEAFRDHWGHRPETDADRRRWLDDPRQDLALWQVAYAGDEVAGVVFPLVDSAENERFGRRRAWLDSVSVRRPWRRRGVARALIVRALLALRERGLTSAVLGVDADNPTGALGLYETVGFRRERNAAAYRKPVGPA